MKPIRNVDQARLRPHLRAPIPPTEAQAFQASKRKKRPRRITDPAKLRGIGLQGHPRNIHLAYVGAHDAIQQLREQERARIISTGDDINLAAILERQDRQCYLCRSPLSVNTLTQEHIIPISKGGTHIHANVAVACQPCNSRKSNRYVAFMIAARKPIYLDR